MIWEILGSIAKDVKEQYERNYERVKDLCKERCRKATDEQLLHKLNDGSVTNPEVLDILIEECNRRGLL